MTTMKAAGSRLPWGGLAMLATLALTACAQDRDIAILRNDIAEFERLVRDFPQSSQVPSALLKTGEAYYVLKDNVQGRRVLRTLIEKYPTSNEAKLAEAKLRIEDRTGAQRPTTGSTSPSR